MFERVKGGTFMAFQSDFNFRMGEELKNKRGDEACPQLLDLIPNERDWRDGGVERLKRGDIRELRDEEEKYLELKLGLPSLSLSSSSTTTTTSGFFSKSLKTNTSNSCAGAKRGFLHTFEDPNEDLKKREQSGLFQLQNRAVMGKELSHLTNGACVEEAVKPQQHKSLDGKAERAVAANGYGGSNNNSETSNRATGTRVVGWPPVRSFRKNLASSSSKLPVEPLRKDAESSEKPPETRIASLVKINMDGIPIGRKIDLKTYDTYDKLSSAVEELFRALLAAQMNPTTADAQKNIDNKQVFEGLLDGTGQYTLVYEDNDGDRMLVGDIPWNMFISTVKRLRVLRTSDLSDLRSGAMSRKTKATDC